MVEARPTTPAQNAAIDAAVNKVLSETHTPGVSDSTLPTLKSHRPSGLRARFAALMTVPALVLAACGVGDKPPATPTTLPTNTPGATQSFEVTPPPPVETPKPTPNETAKPTSPITPESVLKQLEAYQAGDKHALDAYNKPISFTALEAAFAKFKASSSISTLGGLNLDRIFSDCQDPKLSDPNLNESFKQSACANLAYQGLKAADLSGGDPAAVTFSIDMLRYDVTAALKPANLNILVDLLKAQP